MTRNQEENEKDSATHKVAKEQALLRALVTEASRRGDTLKSLARSLGVTYERLAQWRRGEGSIARAKADVYVRAAKYLGLPNVLTIALAGHIGLEDFVWPARQSLRERVSRELLSIRANHFVGAFVPPDLESCPDSVKLFVVFLFHEIQGDSGADRYRWMSAIHTVLSDEHVGSAEGIGRSNKDIPDIF